MADPTPNTPNVRVLGRMLVALERARQELHNQTELAERALERYSFEDEGAREHMNDINHGMRWIHELLRQQIERVVVPEVPTPE